MNKSKNYFICGFLVLIFYALPGLAVNAQPSGKVYCIEDHNTRALAADTVRMGMVYAFKYTYMDSLRIDSLVTTFVLKNDGTTPIEAEPYYLGKYSGITPDHDNDFLEFSKNLNFSVSLNPGDERLFQVKYNPKDTIGFPLGNRYDQLIVRFKKDGIIFKEDSVFLIARKSPHYIDGFQDSVAFDSVWVHPVMPATDIWEVQNNMPFDVKFVEARRDSHSYNPYIMYDNDQLLRYLTPDSIMAGGKFVKPVDLTYLADHWDNKGGIDWAKFRIYFLRDALDPQSLDFTELRTWGRGVVQDLIINNNSSGVVETDSTRFNRNKHYIQVINLGTVRVGQTREVSVYVNNEGNIPFGALSQGVEKADEFLPLPLVTILDPLCKGGIHVPIKGMGYQVIKLGVTPNNLGDFAFRYVVNSDIVDNTKRKIRLFPESAKTFEFVVIGQGSTPTLSTNIKSDTLDFGFINTYESCPKKRDSVIVIANNGSETLNASLFIDDNQYSPFSIDTGVKNNITVPPKGETTVRLTFSTDNQPLGQPILGKLVFSTNGLPRFDTLYLRAQSIEPTYMKFVMDTINAKPGRLIEFPVRVEAGKILLASKFDALIQFDKSLLRFAGYENNRTASQGANKIDLLELSDNGHEKTESISIVMGNNFRTSDTLIILRFYTYLGTKVSTPLSISNMKFADNICENIFNITKSEGVFTLDSICGLDQKAYDPLAGVTFSISEINPNPASDNIEITYTVGIATNVSISLFNSFGQEVASLVDNYMPAGTYVATVSVKDLPPGVYLCNMMTDMSKSSMNIVVTK